MKKTLSFILASLMLVSVGLTGCGDKTTTEGGEAKHTEKIVLATGGNTGAAILLSNGWQLAETMAKTAEPVFASSEMELLSIIISIFKNTPDIPEELKELKKSDVIVKFSRNKTYDLVSRTSALANLINIGIDPGKAIATVDIFDDAQQTTIDSLEMINKILLGKNLQMSTQDKQV